MTEIELLKREIEELKRWKASLEASHSIPLNIDQSFRNRFLSNFLVPSGLGSSSTQNKSLTGEPEVITVPAQPTGTLKVVYLGTTYELLYK